MQAFLAEGLTTCPAGLGSVIIDSQPLSVALLASVLFGERLSRMGQAGLAIGLLGLLVLELPGESVSEAAQLLASGQLLHAEEAGARTGELLMFAAAQSMAVSELRRLRRGALHRLRCRLCSSLRAVEASEGCIGLLSDCLRQTRWC